LQNIWELKGISPLDPLDPAVSQKNGEQGALSSTQNTKTPLQAELDLERGESMVDSSSPHPEVRNDEITPIDTENEETNSGKKAAPPPPRRIHRWTIAHSFLAVSGGLVFDTTDLPYNEKFLPGFRNRVVLTKEAILKVAEREPALIPDIPEASINDKSKASALAKTIVCVQATWFIIQSIVRLRQHLSISLLELNTFAHSLCTLLIYALWWNKPLDVEEPLLIQGEKMRRICAELCSKSQFDGRTDNMWLYLASRDFEAIRILGPRKFKCENYEDKPTQNPREAIRFVPNEEFQNVGITVASRPRVFSTSYTDSQFDFYFLNDLRRWNLAGSQVHNHSNINAKDNILRDRIRNFPTITFDFAIFVDILFENDLDTSLLTKYNRDGYIFLFAFTCAGMTYGAMHLVAWSYPFTGNIQEKLWRISGLAIAASGPSLLILALLLRAIWRLEDIVNSSVTFSRGIGIFTSCLSVVAIICFVLFYICARVFLVVECFISFAYLPDDVFQQPSWSYYIPHIS
jgi:hypothetical protein